MKNHPGEGFYFVFEGGEGVGKTTQINILIRKLRRNYPRLKVVRTREPGGTLLGEEVRKIILSDKYSPIGPRTEALLYASARSQFLEKKIQPVLKRRNIIIADRCYSSSVVYQGIVKGLSENYIYKLHEEILKDAMPDLIIIIDLDPKIGLARKHKQGEVNRFERESLKFHQQVRQGYLKFAKENPKLTKVIDGSLPISDQAFMIWQAVELAIRREKE